MSAKADFVVTLLPTIIPDQVTTDQLIHLTGKATLPKGSYHHRIDRYPGDYIYFRTPAAFEEYQEEIRALSVWQ